MGKKQTEGLYTFMLKDGCYIPGPLLWPSNVTLCTYMYVYIYIKKPWECGLPYLQEKDGLKRSMCWFVGEHC